MILLAGCNTGGSQPIFSATSPTVPSLVATATPADVGVPPLTEASSCPDPMTIIKSFYDSNDAGQFDASLAFFTSDATFSFWAEGVNGRHWHEKHATGTEQIRAVLSGRGLRRTFGQDETLLFHETEAKIFGDQVAFMLRPDRRSSDGRPYNPYTVKVIFQGCQIKSLTVIEFLSGV